MELTNYLKPTKDKNGNKISWGEFLCIYCNKKVIKRLSAGKKQKSCGCVANRLKSESKKGVKKTEKHKQKISETRIKNGTAKGKNNPFYGKKHAEETIQKFKNKIFSKNTTELISIKIKEKWTQTDYRNKQQNRPKESLSNWQGGKSFEPYTPEFNKKLKNFIKFRDIYICQNPKCLGKSKILCIHHIDYNKKNNNPENLITLCNSCHGYTNVKSKKYFWIFYYKNIIKQIYAY